MGWVSGEGPRRRRGRPPEAPRASSSRDQGIRARPRSLRERLSPWGYVRRRRQAALQRAFLADLEGALRGLARVDDYQYHAERFALVARDTGRVVSLDEPFDRYSTATDDERERIVASLRRELSVPTVPDDFEHAAPQLRLEIVSRAADEIARLANPGSQPTGLVLPLCETLSVALYYESPSGRLACTEQHLSRWGCSVEACFRAASMVAGRLGAHLFHAGPDRVRIARFGPRLGAALWRRDELLRGLNFSGSAIAMILDGTQLLIADSGDAGSLAAMVKIAKSSPVHDGLPLTALRAVPGGWARYQPLDENFPAELRELEMRSELRDFARQRLLLSALYERSREPVLVVPAEASTAGGSYTFCRWDRPGDLLLPLTDRVELPGIESRVAHVFPWPDVLPKLRELIETTSLYPPRVRVRQLPPLHLLRTLYSADG